MSTPVGSVTAEIILDSKEFNAAIEKLREDITSLKETLGSSSGTNKLNKDIEELKSKVKSLTDANKDYREQLKKLRDENKKVSDSTKNSSNSLSNFGKSLTELAATLKQYNKDNNRFVESTKKAISALENQAKSNELSAKSFDNARNHLSAYQKQLIAITELIKTYNAENGFSTKPNSAFSSLEKEAKAVEKLKSDVAILNKEFAYLGDNFKVNDKIANTFKNVFDNFNDYHKSVLDDYLSKNPLGGVFAGLEKDQWHFFEAATKGWNDYQARLSRIADGLKAKWHSLTVELAKANAAQYKYWKQIRGTANVEGYNQLTPLKFAGYNSYLADINNITAAVEKLDFSKIHMAGFKEELIKLAEALKTTSAEFNRFGAESDKIITSMSRMAKANEVAAEINKLSQTLTHFSSLSETNSKALSKFSERAKILKDSLRVLETEFMEGRMAEEIYAAETEKLSAQLSKLKAEVTVLIRELSLGNIAIGKNGEIINKNSSEYKKLETNARQAGRGITSFNNGVVQTAHSGRILSNTLYQIRGALLSLKMIATAMGGMALWGFAMEIAEGVKTTFIAKNELEAQLKQNAKVGANGLRDFNKELDVTAKTFQKINKYQLGETVSSLGVEFNLNMKQMKKAMPIVAMVQSEYVRAGRTSEEAALAVKDILQGEFQRLSRETGVGKEELLKYGWSGDKTDIDSLLDAVKKAGDDRNWDIFAAKATSLNDVIEITKNRFEEFGADFLQTISPMVVSAFNTIIGAIDGLQKAFNGMGSFGRNALIGGGFIAGITTIGTILPMVTKGMGLAEIATLGWGKSLATAALNLNKFEVGHYGFKKALAAVITGTKASELANIRTTKAIMGRILGVDQLTLKEKGYLGAMVKSHASLKEGITLLKSHEVYTATRLQKIAYLTGKIDLADVKTLKWNQSIKAIITSTRLWSVALKGLIGIGAIAWFASVATWADAVRGRMDLFNDYIDNGKDKVKSAQKLVDDYNEALGKMSKDDKNYYQTNLNKQTAEHNLKSIQAANDLAKQIKKNTEDTAKDYDMMYQRGINSIYDANGYKATEEYNRDYIQMKYAAYDIAHAEEEREKFQYQSLQHINEHVGLMKQANVDEEKRLKYITEYSVKAEEAAQNLKKFNEGDLTAGAYYVLNRLQLMWIDLWNDSHFVNFWDSVKKTWEDLQPTLNQLVKSLGDLGHILLDFFATDQGQFVGGAIAIGGAIAAIGYKVAPALKKLKDFGSTLKDVLGKVKDWKRETGSDKSPTDDKGDTTSTGGIDGDIGGKGSGSLKTDVKNIFGNRVRSFANNAALIAEGMLLMTEAILLLNAPMGALAATGIVFKAIEPQIRQGIEGLKLITPVIAVFLPPVVALMAITKYFGDAFSTGMGTAFKASAQIIAVGMLLVGEAIAMLVAPMVAIAALGFVKGLLGDSVEKGKAAIEATTDALGALTPIIPVFIIAIGAGLIALTGVGALVSVAVIAAGMGLVAAAIGSLVIPMAAIAALGGLFSDLTGVQKGAEAIKQCAIALKYVSEAFGYIVTVQWDMLKSNIARLLGIDIGTALNDLVEDETGFLPKLSKFAEKFNGLEFVPINEDKAKSLKTTAEGLNAVNDALESAKNAINNLPTEFKNGGTGQPVLSYDMDTATTEVQGTASLTGGSTNYFDQLKQPLEELGKFINWFNTELQFPTEGVDTKKVATITQSAEMVTQINDAVKKVKEVMGNIATGNVTTAFAQSTNNFGLLNLGVINPVVGMAVSAAGGGQGDYQSSIGGQLYEMEMVLKDLSTFNSNVAKLGGGGTGGGDAATGTSGVAQGLTDMVTAVTNAINELQNTLAQAVPAIKTNANNIGTGIKDGIKEGIGNLTEIVVPPLVTAMNAMKANAYTYGKGVGDKGRQGIKETFKVAETIDAELRQALWVMESKKQHFYNKGFQLGAAAAQGVKDGDDMHSPGIMSRTFMQEMAYIDETFDEAIMTAPQKAYMLGETLSSNFNPQLALGGLSVDDLSAFQSGLDTITYMANNTNMQTSTAFTNMDMTTSATMGNMTTTVNGAFTNIDQNATSSYGRIVNTTRTSLKNMQDQTTKNITAIRTSWKGMQTALIASAEQIRSETSAKIHQLEHNMGSFWNKIQNPANLLSAGSPMVSKHTTPQRRPAGSSIKTPKGMLAAGSPSLGQRVTGISDRFKAIGSSDSKMRQKFVEYLQCLLTGGVCAAGGGSGWHFNWSKEIQDVFMQWHTHFGDIYDPYLRVGKFENDDFPVRGIAPIALNYIEDAIGRTKYDFYWDYRYSPLEAWNRGAFNCMDGARLAIAFANAFGFGGGEIRHTTWDGLGHGYAFIPGLGVIDATAIQGGYGRMASKVSYSAGSHTLVRNSSSNPPQMGNTIEGNVVFEIHIDGDVEDAEEKGKEIAQKASEKFIEMFRRSPSTGL